MYKEKANKNSIFTIILITDLLRETQFRFLPRRWLSGELELN